MFHVAFEIKIFAGELQIMTTAMVMQVPRNITVQQAFSVILRRYRTTEHYVLRWIAELIHWLTRRQVPNMNFVDPNGNRVRGGTQLELVPYHIIQEYPTSRGIVITVNIIV